MKKTSRIHDGSNNFSSNRFVDSGSFGNGKNEFGINQSQIGGSLKSLDWSKISVPKFDKNFYQEHEDVASMSQKDLKEFYDEHDMEIIGNDIPKPIKSFSQANFPDYIMNQLEEQNFEEPTSIQKQACPMAMSGRDLVAIAQTGSGKTLAYLLPSLVHINAQPALKRGDGPVALVIAPTRELATQIEQDLHPFASSAGIKHLSVYGGVSRNPQIQKLRNGCDIVICTPGRMIDYLENNETNLHRVTYLVIDEADRLLDMGFSPQLNCIFSQIRPDRQVLMWSATWPQEVRNLAQNFLNKDTIQVKVGSGSLTVNPDIKQEIFCIEEFEKNNLLQKTMSDIYKNAKSKDNVKILVFVAQKKTADLLTDKLAQASWPVGSIHGNKTQHARDEALRDFKQGRIQVLIATDIAARGIHVNDITCVLNYDFPNSISDYIHRVGRTGRCGKKGNSVTFFTHNDIQFANDLIQQIKKSDQQVPDQLVVMSRRTINKKSGNYSRNGGGRSRNKRGRNNRAAYSVDF